MIDHKKVPNIFLWLASIAGFILSVVSMLKICNMSCSEVSNYRIFGMDFGWFGIVYFTILLAAIAIRKRIKWGNWYVALLLFSSAGAELRFIWIQKYEIGQWCPVCLVIASMVFAACTFLVWETFLNINQNGENMLKSKLKFLLTISAFMIIGAGTAMVGVKAEAAEMNLYLGKQNTSTTVYFVSDWYCPACIKMEPEIEKIYPSISKNVRVRFVDFPIHKETISYTPYNLSFLLHEKGKYMQLRKALSSVAKRTTKPTDADVQAAIAPLGVKLRPLDQFEVLEGMQSDLMVYKGHGVKATPSVVVNNSKTKKMKILVGKQISEKAIKAAIAEIS